MPQFLVDAAAADGQRYINSERQEALSTIYVAVNVFESTPFGTASVDALETQFAAAITALRDLIAKTTDP